MLKYVISMCTEHFMSRAGPWSRFREVHDIYEYLVRLKKGGSAWEDLRKAANNFSTIAMISLSSNHRYSQNGWVRQKITSGTKQELTSHVTNSFYIRIQVHAFYPTGIPAKGTHTHLQLYSSLFIHSLIVPAVWTTSPKPRIEASWANVNGNVLNPAMQCDAVNSVFISCFDFEI